MSKVEFHFLKAVTLKDRRRLKKAIAHLFTTEGRALEAISYVFCDDDKILEINQRYLKHDFYTDIISFDLSSSPSAPLIGEIYISVDTVRSNARLHGERLSRELLRVIFHGPLHFCGYGDKTPSQQKLMRQKENKYLAAFSADQ